MKRLLTALLLAITTGLGAQIYHPEPAPPPAPPPEMNEAAPDSLVYSYVEEWPRFPGGEAAFNDYIKKNIQYPEAERNAGKHGTVYVKFTINKDGSVTDVIVVKGVEDAPGLRTEAIRLIAAMPKWTPGRMNGRVVRVAMTKPIRFVLDEDR